MAVGDTMEDLIQEHQYHISLKEQQDHSQDTHLTAQVHRHSHMVYVLVMYIIDNFQHHQDQIRLILLEKK